mmetsp:Transcript_23268/g.65105  ORF Transcript_23268/g.65105 Transcript_23268/m.65105 type:complete len:302 (-) Transcript_23268:296-1201(-)
MHTLAAACSVVLLQSNGLFRLAAAAHYGKPCASDEIAGEVMGETGQVCGPPCDKNFDCPSDVPQDTTAQPQCMLSDIDRKAYCGLLCEYDSQCPSGAACRRAAALEVGLCIYSIPFEEWAQQGARRKLDIGLPYKTPESSKGWEIARAYQALMSLKFNHGVADGDADILVVEELLSVAHQINQAQRAGSGAATQGSSIAARAALAGSTPGHGYSEALSRLIVLFAVYLAAGSAYRHFALGAQGLEMVPHHKFWQDCPTLVADGVKYAIGVGVQLSSGGSRGTSRNYQGPNDHVPSSYEQYL